MARPARPLRRSMRRGWTQPAPSQPLPSPLAAGAERGAAPPARPGLLGWGTSPCPPLAHPVPAQRRLPAPSGLFIYKTKRADQALSCHSVALRTVCLFYDGVSQHLREQEERIVIRIKLYQTAYRWIDLLRN